MSHLKDGSTLDEMETSQFLFGRIHLRYPAIKSLNLPFNIPLWGQVNLPISKVFLTFLFYLGLASSTYILSKYTYIGGRWFLNYLRSLFNAKKYLLSKYDSGNGKQSKYYAVIYGVNRAGFAYAHYLATKGFNLILIDREIQPLNDVELSIKEVIKKNQPEIIKIPLDRFDQESLSKKLYPTRDLPVKLFVNCKNSRRKASRVSGEKGS